MISKAKKKTKRNVPVGVAYILSTFNNSIVTIADIQGNVIAWSSTGMHGFKGSRKSTPYAGQVAATHAAKIAKEHGMRTINVVIRGAGLSRESSVQALQRAGLEILTIRYDALIPHNGCRPRKRRRV
jgi:small subunit ribosomal protein S11